MSLNSGHDTDSLLLQTRAVMFHVNCSACTFFYISMDGSQSEVLC